VPAVPAVFQTQELEVPILTMLPIPFIRIDLTTIDFNAKINSVEYQKTDTNLKIDAALEAKAGWLWGSIVTSFSTKVLWPAAVAGRGRCQRMKYLGFEGAIKPARMLTSHTSSFKPHLSLSP
jgi:hypothetical protein